MKLALTTLVAALLFAAPASAHLLTVKDRPSKTKLENRLAQQSENLAHARYVARHGNGPYRVWHQRWLTILRSERSETERSIVYRQVTRSPASAIRYVFGAHSHEAISVASCESGLSVWATNGQYLGLFQMGEYARSRYGHSSSALGQAQAAYAYFRDSGHDWSPWECKPW